MVIEFDVPRVAGFNRRRSAQWLRLVALKEGVDVRRLSFKAFNCEAMIALNQQFLAHDYNTDILTFVEACAPDPISADFALGWDRIKEQSADFGESFLSELHRVLVHGLLHCISYDDKNALGRAEMRRREDEYLQLHVDCSTWNKNCA